MSSYTSTSFMINHGISDLVVCFLKLGLFINSFIMTIALGEQANIVHCCDDKSILMHSVKIMVWSLVLTKFFSSDFQILIKQLRIYE